MIVYGIYRFRPKRITFRNDYCLSCGVPGRSVQFRTFDALDLFWIPLLPLGFHKQWRCATCGRQPQGRVVDSNGRVWLFCSPSPWRFGGDLKPDTLILGWVVRVAAPIGAVLTLVHLLRTPRNASLAELAAIPAASDTVCPFCGSAVLLLSSGCSCPVCGIVRG